VAAIARTMGRFVECRNRELETVQRTHGAPRAEFEAACVYESAIAARERAATLIPGRPSMREIELDHRRTRTRHPGDLHPSTLTTAAAAQDMPEFPQEPPVRSRVRPPTASIRLPRGIPGAPEWWGGDILDEPPDDPGDGGTIRQAGVAARGAALASHTASQIAPLTPPRSSLCATLLHANSTETVSAICPPLSMAFVATMARLATPAIEAAPSRDDLRSP
jgi:hypothetical protein